jgi:hypothetical protein
LCGESSQGFFDKTLFHDEYAVSSDELANKTYQPEMGNDKSGANAA